MVFYRFHNIQMYKKKKHMRKSSCALIRLTWSLPPHSPAGGFAHKSETPHYYLSRLYRQDLHLSRTMLTTLWAAYVDRFACDWPRLTTTDPYFNIIDYKLYLCLYLYYLQLIQTYVFINITVVRIKNASLNFNV